MAFEDEPFEDPFAEHPELAALDLELDLAAQTVSRTQLQQESLAAAPTVLEIEKVMAGAVYAVDLYPDPDSAEIIKVYLHRSTTEPAPGQSGWWWMPSEVDDQHPWHPITLVGAHLPGSLFGARGVIKIGMGLSFYESTTFRSGSEVIGLSAAPLPVPEELDELMLESCLEQGLIFRADDGLLYWQLPTTAHSTGQVLNVTELMPGIDYESEAAA